MWWWVLLVASLIALAVSIAALVLSQDRPGLHTSMAAAETAWDFRDAIFAQPSPFDNGWNVNVDGSIVDVDE